MKVNDGLQRNSYLQSITGNNGQPAANGNSNNYDSYFKRAIFVC